MDEQQPQNPSEGHLTRHEARRLRREQRKRERLEQTEKQKGKEKRGRIITYFVLVLILILGGYGIYALGSITGNSTGTYDLSGIPSGYIHWHADIDVIICGEDKQLPEAVGEAHIGTGVLHTHSKQVNLQSMPTSDGNGVLHIEGSVLSDPPSFTFGRFMAGIFIPFSETQIMDKKNGDLCPDNSTGQVKVLLNGNELKDPMNYIPRDGDRIDIRFE